MFRKTEGNALIIFDGLCALVCFGVAGVYIEHMGDFWNSGIYGDITMLFSVAGGYLLGSAIKRVYQKRECFHPGQPSEDKNYKQKE